jgi:hypothetical protein
VTNWKQVKVFKNTTLYKGYEFVYSAPLVSEVLHTFLRSCGRNYRQTYRLLCRYQRLLHGLSSRLIGALFSRLCCINARYVMRLLHPTLVATLLLGLRNMCVLVYVLQYKTHILGVCAIETLLRYWILAPGSIPNIDMKLRYEETNMRPRVMNWVWVWKYYAQKNTKWIYGVEVWGDRYETRSFETGYTELIYDGWYKTQALIREDTYASTRRNVTRCDSCHAVFYLWRMLELDPWRIMESTDSCWFEGLKVQALSTTRELWVHCWH